MHDVRPIVAHLRKAHADFLDVCREIPADRWQTSQGGGAWSAAEVVAHLTQVEQAVTSGAAKLLGEAPRPVPIWRRLHLPVSLAQSRGFKVKSPIPMDATLVKERDEMLAKLTSAREQSVSLLLANGRRDLRAYRMAHPFFGSLNFYDWFRVLGYHETRHKKQIREIVESFRK